MNIGKYIQFLETNFEYKSFIEESRKSESGTFSGKFIYRGYEILANITFENGKIIKSEKTIKDIKI